MATHSLHVEHDAHGHDNPYLQHHFATPEQQFEAAKIGMWLFLVTEILLFGGLFASFGYLQAKYPEAFFNAHHHLDKVMGAINTVVLLVSSFTMVMAVWASQVNKRKVLIVNLILTLIFAGVFLVIKYFEYSHKIHDGLLPGVFWSYPNAEFAQEKLFFACYFLMTGVHGVHVLIGMGLITWILIRSIRGEFSTQYNTPVDLVGLYWHLVDMIWIYLFPLLYLVT